MNFSEILDIPHVAELPAIRATGATNTFHWTGGGTATARYSAVNGWGVSDYAFSATPSPTPEPSSVLLLGAGLAGVFFAGRRPLLRS